MADQNHEDDQKLKKGQDRKDGGGNDYRFLRGWSHKRRNEIGQEGK